MTGRENNFIQQFDLKGNGCNRILIRFILKSGVNSKYLPKNNCNMHTITVLACKIVVSKCFATTFYILMGLYQLFRVIKGVIKEINMSRWFIRRARVTGVHWERLRSRREGSQTGYDPDKLLARSLECNHVSRPPPRLYKTIPSSLSRFERGEGQLYQRWLQPVTRSFLSRTRIR